MGIVSHIVAVVFVLAFATRVQCHFWRLESIGRVTSATQLDDAHVILTSAKSAIASIDPKTGETIWRRLPLTPSQTLLDLRVEQVSPTRTLLVTVWSPCLLRIIDAHSGAILTEIPARDYQRLANQQPFIRLSLCTEADGRFSWFSLDAVTHISDEDASHLDVSQLVESTQASLSESLDRPVLSWKLPSGIQITSRADGLLNAVAHNDTSLWHSEEALAHGTQSVFFTSPSSSTLLVLTDLHLVFGLNALDKGQILWKTLLPPNAPRVCKLLPPKSDKAVVVCSDSIDTFVLLIDVTTGEQVEHSISSFATLHTAHDTCNPDKSLICIQLRSRDGALRSVPETCTPCNGIWLHSSSGTELLAYRSINIAWRLPMPHESKLVKVLAPSLNHPASSPIRQPPVRVTGQRKLLFKYVDPDITLTLSADASRRQIHAVLVDARSGSVYNMVTHREAAEPVAATRSDHWFVYSFWSSSMLQQEVHVIDLYERHRNSSWVIDTLRNMAAGTLGPRLSPLLGLRDDDAGDGQCKLKAETDNEQCSVDTNNQPRYPGTPIVVRSSMLLTERVVAMQTTQTELGITQPSILMTLESGQVVMVSKSFLDARRPLQPSKADFREHLIPYRPVISFSSSRKEVSHVTKDIFLSDIRDVAVAPMYRRESSCQVAILGLEILYTLVQPSGNFDRLPVDFRYSAVILTIAALVGSYFYTNLMKRKQGLSRSWQM